MKKIVAVLFSAILITGCATGPAFNEHESNIPALDPKNGRIYIYRDSVFGYAIQPKIWVNGEVVGTAKPKGFLYLDRPVGTYEITTSTEAKRSLSFNLAAGDEKYVRLEVKLGVLVGHVKPILVEPEVGAKQILKTKLINTQTE